MHLFEHVRVCLYAQCQGPGNEHIISFSCIFNKKGRRNKIWLFDSKVDYSCDNKKTLRIMTWMLERVHMQKKIVRHERKSCRILVRPWSSLENGRPNVRKAHFATLNVLGICIREYVLQRIFAVPETSHQPELVHDSHRPLLGRVRDIIEAESRDYVLNVALSFQCCLSVDGEERDGQNQRMLATNWAQSIGRWCVAQVIHESWVAYLEETHVRRVRRRLPVDTCWEQANFSVAVTEQVEGSCTKRHL